ncbi:MAG: hypothetical protein ACK5KT_12065 [Dysgonomonas sp.]
MGFFSRLFANEQQQPVIEEEEKKPLPEIKREDFVDDTDPNEDKGIMYIKYGTGMPIDAVYAYVEKDYEQEGYDDAICNPDSSYKESRKIIIRSGLNRRFEQVRLRYKNDLREIDVQISTVEQQGMMNTSSVLRARRETYSEHLAKIDEMEKRLKEDDIQLLSMLDSYDRGFLRGLAAISQTFLKQDRQK